MDYTKFSVSLEGETWITGRKRSTNRRVQHFITSASFKPGDGLRINKFSYSQDKVKAFGFGKFTAEAIAKQLTDGSWGKRYFGVKVEPIS